MAMKINFTKSTLYDLRCPDRKAAPLHPIL